MKGQAFGAGTFSQVCEVYQVSAVTAFLRNQCTIDNLYLIQHNQNGSTRALQVEKSEEHK